MVLRNRPVFRAVFVCRLPLVIRYNHTSRNPPILKNLLAAYPPGIVILYQNKVYDSEPRNRLPDFW